jgi:hypothetical protein
MLLSFPLAAFAAEPDWWTQQKKDCRLPSSLAYNTWVAQGMPCYGGQFQQPDPGPAALQRAIPRFRTLVHSLYDNYDLIDTAYPYYNLWNKQSWLALPMGTDGEFFQAANQMHKFLVNKIAATQDREGRLREELTELNQVVETYPGLIANLRADIETMRLKRDRLAVALEAPRKELELTQRAGKQLTARAARYEEDARGDKDAIMRFLAVMLPPSMVTVSIKPYTLALDWTSSVPERQRPSELPEPARAIKTFTPAVAFSPAAITPGSLTGTTENAVAQLEADARDFRAAMYNKDAIFDKVEARRAKSKPLEQKRSDAQDERDRLESEISASQGQLNELTTWTLPVAGDELESAKETLFYRAAEAWIWKKARSTTINQVKAEVQRLVAARWFGAKYRDMTDEEVRGFGSTGRGNIFGIGDRVLSSGEPLYKVQNRIQTLLTHDQEYAQEAAWLASRGSLQEIKEFVDGMFKEMDDDCERLVRASLEATKKIPEPWSVIVAKYFLKELE